MEAKDDQSPITDSEFISLLEAARFQDRESILRLIDLYRGDIQRMSKYILLPEEEAISEIIGEFLEFALTKKGFL